MRTLYRLTSVLAYGIVIGIFGVALRDIARVTILPPDRNPFPAILEHGNQDQKGLIGVICWPGWDNGTSDDICPSFFDDFRAPEEPLIVQRGDSVTLDFSRTGGPSNVFTFAIALPVNRVLPVDGTIRWRQRADDRTFQIAALERTPDLSLRTLTFDLPSGPYILYVNAGFTLEDDGQTYFPNYTQYFHVEVHALAPVDAMYQ